MAKYEVIRPWHGVKKGDQVEIKGELHPAIKANVRQVSAAQLDPATQGDRKEAVVARLNELGIEHDARKGVAKLAELLPDGDPLKSE